MNLLSPGFHRQKEELIKFCLLTNEARHERHLWRGLYPGDIQSPATHARASPESPALSLPRFGDVNLPSLQQVFDTLDPSQIPTKRNLVGSSQVILVAMM